MIASSCLLIFLAVVLAVNSSTVRDTPETKPNELESRKIELFDGVYVNIPEKNNTDKIMSFEVDTYKTIGEGRSKKKKMMEKMMPLFIMPFLIQSAIVPVFLSMLKFMLFKSLMVGKFALALIILNAFKNHNSVKGREAEMANVHYGYHGYGMEELGSYFN